MARALYFVLVGLGSFLYWLWSDPTRDISETQDDWPYVLAFSTMLLAIGVALPLLAQLADRLLVLRVSLVAGAGLVLASVANIFEDGLQMEWVFFVFVLCLAIFQLGILVLTIAIVGTCSGLRRLLAVVTGGTQVAVIGFVDVGGPLLLASWLVAAALALALTPRMSPFAAATP